MPLIALIVLGVAATGGTLYVANETLDRLIKLSLIGVAGYVAFKVIK